MKGQSAYSADHFEKIVPVVRPACLQSWAHALDDQFVRPGSRVQRLMEQWDMTFVAFSPLAQARLLDKYDPSRPPTFEPHAPRLEPYASSRLPPRRFPLWLPSQVDRRDLWQWKRR